MRKLLLCGALAVAAVLAPTAVASPTVRLAIVHVMRGCHEWATADNRLLGPSRALVVKRGTGVEIRVNCGMSFAVVQLAGPKLDLGGSQWQPGTARTLRFAKPGVYKLRATNVQSSADMGYETIGPDNTLLLTVRVTS